jgi:hypothetical protein
MISRYFKSSLVEDFKFIRNINISLQTSFLEMLLLVMKITEILVVFV